MQASLSEAIKAYFKTSVLNYTPVAGGDINDAFKVIVNHRNFFIKSNNSANAFQLLSTEYKALITFEKLAGIPIPKLMEPVEYEFGTFLAMEFISSGHKSKMGWTNLAKNLATLHQISSDHFGWEEDNFIGTLPQRNTLYTDWYTFYINERLTPQFELAFKNEYFDQRHFETIEQFKLNIRPVLKGVTPSLIHGDLWSGNFIIGEKGEAFLIDPSAYFGHREIDLAMAKLFGGFDVQFHKEYNELYPLAKGYFNREPIYQLYYLLVHLNLFGDSYFNRCWNIISSFVKE